jgi:hypothetical protein
MAQNTNFVQNNQFAEGGHTNNKNIRSDLVYLTLSMSCDTFWDYDLQLPVDSGQFSRKYNNQTEEEAFQNLSQFLCLRMKQHIQDDLINTGRREMLSKLEEVFPKFHIHGQTSHEILYPNDPSNSAHCRDDGKIFICTHC